MNCVSYITPKLTRNRNISRDSIVATDSDLYANLWVDDVSKGGKKGTLNDLIGCWVKGGSKLKRKLKALIVVACQNAETSWSPEDLFYCKNNHFDRGQFHRSLVTHAYGILLVPNNSVT